MAAVFDWSRARLYRTDNPCDGIEAGLPKQKDKVQHHAALPIDAVPGFVMSLQEDAAGELTRLALEFLILTAARSGEVRGATWGEVNLAKATWTVPAERMKARRAHVVPLPKRCIAILEIAAKLTDGDGLIFPNWRTGKPLSDMTFTMLLRRRELAATAHGFRSAFRDWVSEHTSFPSEVAEMALAHVVANKVEAAYRRGDLLEKRRQLMDAWAAFVLTAPANNVVLLARPMRA